MAWTVAQAFNEFAAKLKPTDAQWETIKSRRTAVAGFLGSAYPAGSNMPLLETKLIGSAQRKTLIRPVDDVDVFAVFDDRHVWRQYKHDSKHLLYRVRDALSDYRMQTVGSRGQAVRLFYNNGPNVDITPAFVVRDFFGYERGYYIPRGDGGWQQTDPFVHHQFMSQRNKELDKRLKPLIRLLKRWNNIHSRRLNSFHLELTAQAIFGVIGSNSRLALAFFFQHAYGHLHVKDPAGYSGDMASRLTAVQQLAIRQSFETALAQAGRALDAEDQGRTETAIKQWRVVFGDEFPSYD